MGSFIYSLIVGKYFLTGRKNLPPCPENISGVPVWSEPHRRDSTLWEQAYGLKPGKADQAEKVLMVIIYE
ncbi:hypothetical protein D6Y73_04740 [Escherichia coli]|nr:hypothetical protein [Escherichia coli]EEW7559725.1 hypothetical protein [Escherichia coli]EEW7622531.1 hypothetical protein [Escherichia coli]EEW7654269.1 hypothetical protein [Escherichia coli]MGQ07589.1 hypothetical protein [Escherichia coli]